jgi:hypothetical protein
VQNNKILEFPDKKIWEDRRVQIGEDIKVALDFAKEKHEIHLSLIALRLLTEFDVYKRHQKIRDELDMRPMKLKEDVDQVIDRGNDVLSWVQEGQVPRNEAVAFRDLMTSMVSFCDWIAVPDLDEKTLDKMQRFLESCETEPVQSLWVQADKSNNADAFRKAVQAARDKVIAKKRQK